MPADIASGSFSDSLMSLQDGILHVLVLDLFADMYQYFSMIALASIRVLRTEIGVVNKSDHRLRLLHLPILRSIQVRLPRRVPENPSLSVALLKLGSDRFTMAAG